MAHEHGGVLTVMANSDNEAVQEVGRRFQKIVKYKDEIFLLFTYAMNIIHLKNTLKIIGLLYSTSCRTCPETPD